MRITRSGAVLLVLAVTPVLVGLVAPAGADERDPERDTEKVPVAVGSGGGLATVDADVTRIGYEVLAAGGTATDAAVAAAAAIGVAEPYAAGIGGGGFFMHYDGETGEISTIDGREAAPARMRPDSFVDPATGEVLDFDRAVTSGLSVGAPGTVATWERALQNWGARDFADALAPSARLARDGFVVDQTFHDQTASNAERFRLFPASAELFLPDGEPPAVGSRFTNPDLADTYTELGERGAAWFYRGRLATEVARAAARPQVDPDATIPVARGLLTPGDLARYRVEDREPTHSTYRGLDVYGMAPPSSGGSTVGEALNILDRFTLSPADPVQATHLSLEASRLAFADRNRYIGDPGFVDVPLDGLLSPEFAAQRACLIDPQQAAPGPVAPGDPAAGPDCRAAAPRIDAQREGPSTTHLVVSDRWGDVVAYTLTIEQTGGSGITVPGRGFLLNNELTDFDIAPPAPGEPLPANAPDGGKRPRSSMSPTLVLDSGEPVLAVGSPGGATIITTVLQILVGRIDLGMTLPEAVAAPRLSQQNRAETLAEPAVLDGPLGAALARYGHQLSPGGRIGNAAGLEFLDDGRVRYVAEPTRAEGGSAMALP